LIGTSSTGSPFSVTWNSLPANGAYRVVSYVVNNVTNKAGPSSPTVPVTITH
jgi:hypothetical protein